MHWSENDDHLGRSHRKWSLVEDLAYEQVNIYTKGLSKKKRGRIVFIRVWIMLLTTEKRASQCYYYILIMHECIFRVGEGKAYRFAINLGAGTWLSNYKAHANDRITPGPEINKKNITKPRGFRGPLDLPGHHEGLIVKMGVLSGRPSVTFVQTEPGLTSVFKNVSGLVDQGIFFLQNLSGLMDLAFPAGLWHKNHPGACRQWHG